MLLARFISICHIVLWVTFSSTAQGYLSTRVTKYTQNEGLSSNHVTKILRDKYGFIWVATQEGVNVFDGTSYKLFSNQSKAKRNLQGSYIQDMIEDKKRSLVWVLPSFAPLCGIDVKARTITTRINKDSDNLPLTEVWARSVTLQEDILWIGGLNTLSAYHIPSGTFIDVSSIKQKLKSLGEYNISKIKIDAFENTWLLIDGKGIIVLNKEKKIIKDFSAKELGSEQYLEELFFWGAVVTRNQIIIGTRWGMINFHTSNKPEDIQLQKISLANFYNKPIYSLTTISDSLMVFSTNSSLFLQNVNTGDYHEFLNLNLGSKGISDVFTSYHDINTGITWLGSNSGLMSFPNNLSKFKSFSKLANTKYPLNHINTLLTENQSSIYTGSTNGLYKIYTESNQIELLDSTVYALMIFHGPENQIYVSAEKELSIIKEKKPRLQNKQIQKIPINLQGSQFHSHISYNDSLHILASYESGLKIWNTFNNLITNFPNDSIQNLFPGIRHINNLFKSSINNDIYILTGDAIVSLNPLINTFKGFSLQDSTAQKTLRNFMDMNESPDSYFIGTYGDGLVETDKQFNVKRIYTTEDGLSNNCIYRIFNIDDEKMLMTTNNGLSILNLKTRKFKTYYEGDGLHGNGFEQFCGYQKDNKIYVGGPGGFTIVNTDLLPDSSIAPILYPTGIEINTPEGIIDSTHLEMSSFTVPNDAFKTTLKFVSPDYKNADRMSYRYKIDELSDEWVNLGNQNFVDLIGVNPGTYHFQVVAKNSEGTDSEPLQMTLDFLPKWYQTIWFKILLLLLVAGLVYWIQRYRMIQIQKQQFIRKEIANDLHDDIGSTLNSLKIFAHLAQSDTNNKSHIEQIEESISEATVGLRDMIWVLEDEQDSVYEIMERIKKFASPICMAHDIEFVSTVKATSEKAIPKKIKRNLFLVAKECINNSVKYADCSMIDVTVEYSKSRLKLTIADNGKGFNSEDITKGKGLDSMQYRAQQVNFDCHITSNTESGTSTELIGEV